jgi:ATP-binding cassette, subfamily B, bacterial
MYNDCIVSVMKNQSSIIYPRVKVAEVIYFFWQGIKPQKWWFYFLIFCIIGANVTGIIVPLFYKDFFDTIVLGGNKLIVAKSLLVIIFYILFLNVIQWVFYRLATLANIKYQINTIARLKQNSYNHLIEHSYSFFAGNFVGSLVQKVNRSARSFERLSDNLIWNLLPLAIKLVMIFTVVFFINRQIALVLLLWACIFLLFNIIFSQWKLKYDLKFSAMDSKTTAYLADTLTNQNTVSLFSAFKRESEGYKKVTNEHAAIGTFTWTLDGIIEGGQHILGVIIEFLIFAMALLYWQQGIITIGVFVLLSSYIIDLVHQLWGFTRIIRDTYHNYADSKEMVEIMMLDHEIIDIPSAKKLSIDRGVIEFKSLEFSFHGTRKVLNDINIAIKPGEKVALIGPSGAGKTTFIRLLLRLYTPTKGHILIDGQDITKVTQESLRDNIALVPQDPILFHRTLAENIAYGKPRASKKEIKKAAQMAHCDEFINNLPSGLETFVGERGIKLSGGERQRVAIARAILKSAPILVLDEATSSLDSYSEMLIQDALNNLMQGKTVIVIAHRLSTIQKMDRIIVIDEGKIVEQGKHEELLENENSTYRKLWKLQAGGFLKEEEDSEESNQEINLSEE